MYSTVIPKEHLTPVLTSHFVSENDANFFVSELFVREIGASTGGIDRKMDNS